jgi:hydroxymethylpyrimidine/phosphomethylpyrimidine kinase
MIGRVLVIAGSDSGAGAGIQADIKTAMALGAYATTALTALTAQDTTGVHEVHPVPLPFLRRQIEVVLADIGADAVKTGMLGDADTIALVAELLAPAGLPLVLDPVMVAKGGARLLAVEAIAALKRHLLPLATLLTPNIPEAEALTGMTITDLPSMHDAAQALLTLGVPAVLLKGGHMPGDRVMDLLTTVEGTEVFQHKRIATPHTHGTGCTLATAIAVGLAQGMDLPAAVARAESYVHAAIATAPGLGAGSGPLNHAASF